MGRKNKKDDKEEVHFRGETQNPKRGCALQIEGLSREIRIFLFVILSHVMLCLPFSFLTSGVRLITASVQIELLAILCPSP